MKPALPRPQRGEDRLTTFEVLHRRRIPVDAAAVANTASPRIETEALALASLQAEVAALREEVAELRKMIEELGVRGEE